MSHYREIIGRHLGDQKWTHFERSYESVFNKSLSHPLHDNVEYMQLVEFKFILKNLRELNQNSLYQNYCKPDTIVQLNESNTIAKRSMLDQAKLRDEIDNIDAAIISLNEYIGDRLKASSDHNQPFPRMVKLCQTYGFTPNEAELFELMVVVQGANSSAVLNSLLEEDLLRKMSGYKRLSGMSDVDIDTFCDSERAHMKENIVAVDEESGMQYNLRIQNVAVQLLYGRKVRSDDLLKISQTALEQILFSESGEQEATSPEIANGSANTPLGKRSRTSMGSMDEEGSVMDEEEEGSVAYDDETASVPSTYMHGMRPPKIARSQSWGPGARVPHAPFSATSPLKRPAHPAGLKHSPSAQPTPQPNSASNADHVVLESDNGSSLTPYSSEQLDYLEDCFQWIALMIKGNVAKMKDDMKKEGTSRNVTWGDNVTDIKHSKRELVAKIKLQETRIEKRLAKTVEAGLHIPRLEELVKKFKLDLFEKGLILLLIGKTVSPIVRALLDTLDSTPQQIADDVITVGQALSILCQNFHNQIFSRRYFYQNSKLLTNALVTLTKSRWNSGTGDLTENKILLDRRILDYIVGLDSEINELVEGSDLYTPNIPLDTVVLPRDHKALLLSQCAAYDVYVRYRQHLIDASADKKASAIPYGNSLVILLCGTPGTGKTMTVNAIATELKKKVLMVDFNSLVNKKDSQQADIEIDLKGLFRESKLSNALLFFDECEHIFKNRNFGSDRIINSLLIEIEKHEGVVFLATNRAHELDEAMHRRITMVLEYSTPDKYMRKIIWDNLLAGMTVREGQAQDEDIAEPITALDVCVPDADGDKDKEKPPSKIVLSADVDTSVLASKYTLTGGFIKNAVLSAILMALSRDQRRPVMHHTDLLLACQMQMRGNLTQKAFESRQVNADKALSKLYVSEAHKAVIQKIVHFERTRQTVYGSWTLQAAETADVTSGAGIVKSSSASSLGGVSSLVHSLRTSHPSALRAAPAPVAAGHELNEKACITLIAGLQGSGKYTIVETIGNELKAKHIKYIHIGDFVYNSAFEVAELFKILIKDAAILDAMIVISGFEHLLDDNTGEGGGNKVQLTLARVMDILFDFRGPVFLLANLDNPQNVTLQRDFSSRLFAFLRITLPSADLRGKLWKALIPSGAPVAADIDYTMLGRKFDLFAGDIQNAIAFAAAEVASRESGRTITQKDLMAAGEHEIAKCKGDHADMISKLFA